MSIKKVSDLFNKRYFEIPKYQRSYSWEQRHVRELFEDIRESMESNSPHYLGTIVLSEAGPNGEDFYVVDGQQRLVTIMLIISEITRRFTKNDSEYYRRFYIKDQKYKMILLGKDQKYFEKLLEGNPLNPESKSQRLLKGAYEEIKNQLNGHTDLYKLFTYVERLEVLEFIEKSEGDAIRIFQTVNDRGKLLSNMEKAKALLIYHSNRYLAKSLDAKINNTFGEIFELYDEIKSIAEEENISLINNENFNEDYIMRYHFISFSNENYDATAEYVLNFLKRVLMEYRSKGDLEAMERFITLYADSLLSFFRSLKSIIEKTKTNAKYYGIFSILNLSATMYPLTVMLEQLGILDEIVPNCTTPFGDTCTFLDLIELVDVRVYKTRGTDPRAQISRFAYDLNDKTKAIGKEEIKDWLLSFNKSWMSSGEFEFRMKHNAYHNPALKYILIDYCQYLENTTFTKEQLKSFVLESPEIEHVVPKENKDFSAFGFSDDNEFEEKKDRIGNLTLLERNLNKLARNSHPLQKTTFYDRSIFKMTRNLSSEIAKRKKFDKQAIEARAQEIWKYISKRWWV